MNAMSVSPVKPSINSGNHAIPTTATNLSKNPPPPSNSFAPINLVPENKPLSVPVPAVNVTPASAEGSMDLCSKPPPTSNGTASPSPESNLKECPVVQQNHNENCDIAENLSTTDNPPAKPAESAPELKGVVEEKSKSCETKSVTPSKENSEPIKEAVKETISVPKIETVKDIPKAEECSSVKLGKKDESPVKSSEERTSSKQPEISSVKTDCESVAEPKKETPPASEENSNVEEVKEENVEKKVQNADDGAKSDSPAESTPTPPKTTKRKAKQPVEQVDEDSNEGRKSKRVRLPTQPFQCPIPELQFIAKLQTPAKTTPKPSTEKIIAFYKNEFLAVRNPEGSFYICQTFQNIHRNSSRIKIRWFTNLPQDIFTPDFCDHTEFDCILTNVQMTRVEKDRWKLPDYERTRIENILKRALDVEKGVVDTPSITEEHPDGLDLSLFKDEAQLSKKKRKKKKSASPNAKSKVEKTKKQPAKPTKATKTAAVSTKKSARLSNLSQTPAKEVEKVKAAETKGKKEKKKAKHAAKKSPTKQNDKSNAKVWEPSVKSSNSSKVVLSLKKEAKAETTTTTTTKTATKRTSAVSSRASANSTAATPPQKRKKEENKTSNAAANQPASAERSGKVRNAGSAVTAKINSAAMRTTKDKELKVSNSTSQRKK